MVRRYPASAPAQALRPAARGGAHHCALQPLAVPDLVGRHPLHRAAGVVLAGQGEGLAVIATGASASVARRAHWTVDQALSWMHEGSEPDALMFAGPHRSAENFGRLLDVLKQGRIVASTLEPTGQRRDLRPDEWMDLELWEDDRPAMFADFDFAMDEADAWPEAPILVRTRSVIHRNHRTGPCVPSAAEASSEPGSVQWFHAVRDHVLFPAEQVRASFPLPARTAAQQKRAHDVADAELRRILAASPGLRLLSDAILRDHVGAISKKHGGKLSQADFRELKASIVGELGASAWTAPGAPCKSDRDEIDKRLTDLGLAHLTSGPTINPK